MTGWSFNRLASHVDLERPLPDLVIRNASYFRRLALDVPTISVVQDILEDGSLRDMQADVIEHSTVSVYNSEYTLDMVGVPGCAAVIPIGVDFDLFRPGPGGRKILWVGSGNKIKGPELFVEIAERLPDEEFICVSKDGFHPTLPNVSCYHRVSHDVLSALMGSCNIVLCTSVMETQHLAGLEAAASGLAIAATNVGMYWQRAPGQWGLICEPNAGAFAAGIRTLRCWSELDPRGYFLERGYDVRSCKKRWQELVRSSVGVQGPGVDTLHAEGA
jgi:glycosyltransferase involved in cell wall biosynthesis